MEPFRGEDGGRTREEEWHNMHPIACWGSWGLNNLSDDHAMQGNITAAKPAYSCIISIPFSARHI